jgi:nitrite reductase/ring-hydroxylating ferredoxin subunit
VPDANWTEVGQVDELKHKPLQEVVCGQTTLALSYHEGRFAAISGVCNHMGGPLGRGSRWTAIMWSVPGTTGSFIGETGQGEAGLRGGLRAQPMRVMVDGGRLSTSTSRPPRSGRKLPHVTPSPGPSDCSAQAGPIRVVGSCHHRR